MSAPDRHRRPATGGGGARRRTGAGAVAGFAALALTLALAFGASGALGVKKAPPPAPAKAASVFPPKAHPYGRSLAEWSAAWWEFTLAIPDHDATAPGHPPNCRPSDDGRVWFLVGIFSPIGALDCELPAGASLFLPVLNVECSSIEAPPFFGRTAAEQRACATAILNGASGLSATIDGRAVPTIGAYRVVSPPFTIGPLPEGNRLGLPAGTAGTGVGDGVYLMVRPLRPGTHTIRITGALAEFGFALDTTITVVVAPKR